LFNKMKIAILIAVFVFAVQSKYVYIPNMEVPSTSVIYQSGSNHYEDLVSQCDALGIQCAGFDTYGNILSSLNGATPNTYFSLFKKTGGVTPTPLPRLWPLPQQLTLGNTTITLGTPFAFSPSINDDILNGAIQRYTNIIFTQGNTNYVRGDINSVSIVVQSDDDTLQLATDESYSLSITSNNAVLKSKTIYGAMRGLETFSQLAEWNFDNAQYEVALGPVSINDFPQFPHRGILIDVSRHFIPIAQIQNVIDSLSYAKMNVLHLHASDTQSFPIESKSWPLLWQGSYSKRERFTQQQLIDLVQYGKERGVRIIPEFDGPGHMFAWGVGYPELLPSGWDQTTACYNVCPNDPCDVPIDPSNPMTYQVLDGFTNEMTDVFMDDFYHLGGDEVEAACWNQSAQIVAFMEEHNLTTFDDLYMYFVQQYENIALSYNKTPVHWEEVFNHFGTKLNKDVIIHVWLSLATVQAVATAGYRVIVSNMDVWYLDHTDVDWTQFYKNDPLHGVPSNATQFVLGGQTCMWGESVDISDQLPRIWPKTAAVAERLWNYNIVNQPSSVELAIPRLQRFRCSLEERGIGTAPLYSPAPFLPGSCFST